MFLSFCLVISRLLFKFLRKLCVCVYLFDINTTICVYVTYTPKSTRGRHNNISIFGLKFMRFKIALYIFHFHNTHTWYKTIFVRDMMVCVCVHTNIHYNKLNRDPCSCCLSFIYIRKKNSY